MKPNKLRIVITGSNGFLGSNVYAHLSGLGYDVHGGDINIDGSDTSQTQVDTSNEIELAVFLNQIKPQVIIHCAAVKSLLNCEENKIETILANVMSTNLLAEYCIAHSAKLIYISSDVVFDGCKGDYRPEDPISPINWYGKTKAFGEICARIAPKTTIFRTALIIGKLDKRYERLLRSEVTDDVLSNQSLFPQYVYTKLKNGTNVKLSEVYYSNPTPVELVCFFIEQAVINDIFGTYHATGPDILNRFEFGQIIAHQHNFDERLIIKDNSIKSMLRPQNLSMNNDSSYTQFKVDNSKWRMKNYLSRSDLYV